mmetsp:Transcript_5633/g.11656  ORF Transcript_5633/g.11656 Transcript_5633/m.11656 type:complete len:216 (-) Transcript_5633:616-1263(-)
MLCFAIAAASLLVITKRPLSQRSNLQSKHIDQLGHFNHSFNLGHSRFPSVGEQIIFVQPFQDSRHDGQFGIFRTRNCGIMIAAARVHRSAGCPFAPGTQSCQLNLRRSLWLEPYEQQLQGLIGIVRSEKTQFGPHEKGFDCLECKHLQVLVGFICYRAIVLRRLLKGQGQYLYRDSVQLFERRWIGIRRRTENLLLFVCCFSRRVTLENILDTAN